MDDARWQRMEKKVAAEEFLGELLDSRTTKQKAIQHVLNHDRDIEAATRDNAAKQLDYYLSYHKRGEWTMVTVLRTYKEWLRTPAASVKEGT